jgi:2-hydroxy-4-carboxymuconate semialdehyde hemiacetal dehydrogenase
MEQGSGEREVVVVERRTMAMVRRCPCRRATRPPGTLCWSRVRIALAGAGAFGVKHLEALASLDGVAVTWVVSRRIEQAREVATRYGVLHASADLDEVLARDDVDAVILCTPSPSHARQAVDVLRAGKHVQVEIPLATGLADALMVDRVQRETGLVCMVGHTRRFNSSHQWMHGRILAGELSIHQLAVRTSFLRRTNTNAQGRPRSWTDHLLWHHAAHTVDLFCYQTSEPVQVANAVQGPLDPGLGIALDLSIQLRTPAGRVCSLSLSFNDDGPIGTSFRYICDNGTYVARYDQLCTGHGVPVDVPGEDGIAAQDREFVTAIRERREPNAGVASVLTCYRVLDRIERQLADQR